MFRHGQGHAIPRLHLIEVSWPDRPDRGFSEFPRKMGGFLKGLC